MLDGITTTIKGGNHKLYMLLRAYRKVCYERAIVYSEQARKWQDTSELENFGTVMSKIIFANVKNSIKKMGVIKSVGFKRRVKRVDAREEAQESEEAKRNKNKADANEDDE